MARLQDSHTLGDSGYSSAKASGRGADVSCRVIILYANALFGHGLRSLLVRHGEFEIPLVLPKDADLAPAVRDHRPDVIIVVGELLSARIARALLEAAW